jgi:hypothetical protein
MFRDGVLALGLLMSTASQFRPGASPVGVGEIFLVGWLLLMFYDQLTYRDRALTSALSILLGFWGAFTFAECVGFITGLALGNRADPQWLLHDIMAYPLVAVVSCLLGLETAFRLGRITRLLAIFGSIALAIQIANAAGVVAIPTVDPWYWDRLRGWSANPNQLAFLCAALTLSSLHLADIAGDNIERLVAILCMILPFVVGRLTGSDTFTLMLLAAAALFLGAKLAMSLRMPGSQLQPRVACALILVIAIPLLAASTVPASLFMSTATGNVAMGLMKNGGKAAHEEADLRLELWKQALERGFSAGMAGLGPGPHLAIPSSLVKARASEAGQPGNIQHPENNGAPNFEAHNTILDLFVQGGILADLSFFWLLGTAVSYSYRGRLAGLTTLLCGLTLFGMTNLIIRQPLFWFAIVSCIVAGTSRMPAPGEATLKLVHSKQKAVV